MDFENDLYKPLKESHLQADHTFIFPHEKGQYVSTKEMIQTSDFVVAEVSQAATGVGIELGWADAFDKPIICIYRAGTKPSGSLKFLTNNFVEYHDPGELAHKLEEFILHV
jgi:hypothetical protein